LLLAGFAAHQVLDYASSTPLKARFGLEIEVAIEPECAGIGGALWHARDRLDDLFFLLNGDSWFDLNLLELADRVASEPSATLGSQGVLRASQQVSAGRSGRSRQSLQGDP